MAPPFPSITKKWHSEPYPAIDPTRPELSCKGKVVVITGGGGSIGGALAKAFALAGAEQIAVVGRSVENLEKTKSSVEDEVKRSKITPVKGDIADESSINEAFSKIAKELGKIDILVANAGYLPHFETIAGADAKEWWTGFQINALGAFNTARAFLTYAADDAHLVNISTGPIHMPTMSGGSGYLASKMAGTRVWDAVNSENPNISVVHVHPGVVYSDINVKSGITAVDSADLPAQFIVWAVSQEANFLNGKFLWANWDVEELKSKESELKGPFELILTLQGWPWGQNPDSGALDY